MPFLPVRTDLLPKRNQARQKMATLSIPRFQELAAEVLFEIEKRYSWLVEEYESQKSHSSVYTNTPKQVVPPSTSMESSIPQQYRPATSMDEIDRIRADYEFKIAHLEQELRAAKTNDRLVSLERLLSEQKEVIYCINLSSLAYKVCFYQV